MKLYLIRGLPGSGKSTYAKSLGCFHVEADMYHVKNGEYLFDGAKGKLAHRWCQNTCWNAMISGMDVAVSNTFTQKWELDPYLSFAKDTGHEVVILRMTGNYGTIHNVPAEIIQKMADRFEDIDAEL